MKILKSGIFIKIFISFWISLFAFSILSIFLYIVSDPEFIRILKIKAQHSKEINHNIHVEENFRRMNREDFFKYLKGISKKSNEDIYLFNSEYKEIAGKQISSEDLKLVHALADEELRYLRQQRGEKILNAFLLRDTNGNISPDVTYILTAFPRLSLKDFLESWLREYYTEMLIHLFVVSMVSFFLARHFAVPLKEINEASDKIAAGAFDITLSDVTHRNDEFGDLARNFIGMAERLEENRFQQMRMFRDISHELRSPLTRMRLAIELALAKADEPTGKLLRRIELEWDRMSAMIADLKIVSDYEEKKIRLDEINLLYLIENLMPDFYFEAEASGKTIVYIQSEECVVKGSKNLLASTIENIVRNALMYARKEITLSLTKEDGNAVISVTDDGKGVLDENLEMIFSPFFRENTDRDRKTGGTGLGLAIAKRAVFAHKGSIFAENLNGGFRITVKLPI